ncbi:MAG: hypothetical protein L0211_04645 [Planctomycetaceae bacterium]|nr:hypothetical protein [Planctomycetaceae bacterium]
MSLRFSLLGLVALVSFAGLATAALVRPGPQWLSVVVTLTAVMIVAQSLRAVLHAGESRAAAIGWLLFAVAYLALAMGPWLGAVVGPDLLSSKALNYAQVQWRKESPPEARVELLTGMDLDLNGTPANYYISNNGWVTDVRGWFYYKNSTLAGAQQVSVNYFHASGQWLIALLAGWLGSAIAAVMWRRGQPGTPHEGPSRGA